MHSFFRSVLLFMLLTAPVAGWSQETAPATDEERSARFEQLREEITLEQRGITRLETHIESSKGGVAAVLIARRDLERNQAFKTILTFAREVAEARANGADVANEVNEVIALLEPLPTQAFNAVERMRDGLVFPTKEMEPAEFVVLDQELLQNINDLDDIYGVIVDYMLSGII